MRKTTWLALAILALAALASACAQGQRSNSDLPDYAYRSEAALKGYQTALEHRGLLTRLPCYCGCGKDPQYTSLADCFFDPKGGYNSHASNCAVCLEEAEDAAQWRKQGMGLAGVRQSIDDKYQGRGPTTETPPIAPGEEIVP